MRAVRLLARSRAKWCVALLVLAGGCSDAHEPTSLSRLVAVQPSPMTSSSDVVAASQPWGMLPELASGRADLGVVAYGPCVWTIGGWTADFNATTTVERLCPRTSSMWSEGPPLPEPLSRFGGVGVIGNRLYVAGGVGLDARARRSVYVYHPETGWRRSAVDMPFPIGCGAGTVVGERLYVYGWKPRAGGRVEDFFNCMYEYEPVFAVFDPAAPASSQWRVLPPEPQGPVSSGGRCFHSMAAVGARIYVLGGNENCGGKFATEGAGAFDTNTNQWLASTAVPSPGLRYGQTLVTLNDRLYALGGYNGDLHWQPAAEARVYEPTINAWDELPSMPLGLTFGGAAGAPGRIVVAGGGFFYSGVATAQLAAPAGCDVHEPDGAIATASPWNLQTDLGGALTPPYRMSLARICSRSDVDYFLIRALGWTNGYDVVLTPPAGTDYQLELLNARGTDVLQRSVQPGSQKEVVRVPTGSRAFLLRVSSQDGSFEAQHPYTLEVP